MRKATADALKAIRKMGQSVGVKPQGIDAFIKCMECGVAGKAMDVPQCPEELRKAITDQNRIGIGKLYCKDSWPRPGRAPSRQQDVNEQHDVSNTSTSPSGQPYSNRCGIYQELYPETYTQSV
jgi:hypothetical protein